MSGPSSGITREERQEIYDMLRYFWDTKENPTIWNFWAQKKHLYPEVVQAWRRLQRAKLAMLHAINNFGEGKTLG